MSTADKFRVKFIDDPDAQFEECNGESRPLTREEYAQNPYLESEGTTEIPYERYLAYQGNPERHVFASCIVEKQCHCCGKWSVAASLHNIDMMDDNKELRDMDKWFAAEDVSKLTGYFVEIAREMLAEAGYEGGK